MQRNIENLGLFMSWIAKALLTEGLECMYEAYDYA